MFHNFHTGFRTPDTFVAMRDMIWPRTMGNEWFWMSVTGLSREVSILYDDETACIFLDQLQNIPYPARDWTSETVAREVGI